MKTECSGVYSVELLKANGNGDPIESTSRTVMSGVENIVLNQGLLRMGVADDYLNVCSVGSGAGTPQPSDTGLQNQIASTSTASAIVSGAQPAEPYYGWARRTFTFAVGAVVGNVSELAVGWGGAGQIFSRALARGGNGNPVAIPVLADEVLRVTYEHRYYPNVNDTTGVLNLTGALGGEYAYTIRPAFVSSGNYWNAQYAQSNGTRQPITAYNGGIGSVTGEPAGGRATMTGVTASVAGTSATFAISAENENLNVAGGIKSLMFAMGNGVYQIEFTPAIPKVADSSLRLQFRHAWGRR